MQAGSRLFARLGSSAFFRRSRLFSTTKPEKKTPYIMYSIYGGILGTACAMMYSRGAPTEEEKAQGDNDSSILANYKRVFKRFGSSVETMNDSAFEKLLPDQPMTHGDHKPMTLVIDLDGFLVSHIWDPIQGRWRIAKRPGADLFLYSAAHMYEVVIFSSMNQFEGEQILEKLDPMQFVTWRLFRFATNYKDGVYYKQLEKLNRDLGQVVVVGHDQVFRKYPHNFVEVPKWTGDPEDYSLYEAVDFMESLAYSRPKDCRKALQTFEGKNPIDEFQLKQRALYENVRQERLATNTSWLRWIVTSAFMPDLLKGTDQDLLPYEQRRSIMIEQRTKEYEKDMVRIRTEYEKQMERNKAYLSSQKMPLMDLITKGPTPPPPEIVSQQ